MSQNFINDLTSALERIIRPDIALLKEILIVGGMPEKTENLRYLGFNRHVVQDGEDRTLEFSAVAMLNNRRIDKWRLAGYKKKVSQVVFSTRWTRNPLDLFMNALRCDDEIMDIFDSSSAPYTLLGILHIDEIKKTGFVKRLVRPHAPQRGASRSGRRKSGQDCRFRKAKRNRQIQCQGHRPLQKGRKERPISQPGGLPPNAMLLFRQKRGGPFRFLDSFRCSRDTCRAPSFRLSYW